VSDFAAIIHERRGPVAFIRLNRPEKHHAINSVMARELIECLDALEADDEVRVIVLTGAGEKAFCAGADMAEAVAQDISDGQDRRDHAAQAAWRLAQVKKPLLAAVNGYAYGGGAVFAITCDIRLASENAKFRFVGASYGLSVGASQLPRLVGAAMAKELIFTARTVDADEALRIGLVNHVTLLSDLEATTMQMAEAVAQNSPAAIRASKEVIDLATLDLRAVKREAEHNRDLRASEEHRSRFRAAADRVTGGPSATRD
jgi:enoyl-CoA hydratase